MPRPGQYIRTPEMRRRRSEMMKGKNCGRINYDLYSYCRNCQLVVSKIYIRCPECKNSVRQKAHRKRSVGRVYY